MFYKEEFSLEQFCQESIYSWYVPNFCIITILLINRPRNTHRQKFKTSGVVFTPVIFNSMLALFLFCFCFFFFLFLNSLVHQIKNLSLSVKKFIWAAHFRI